MGPGPTAVVGNKAEQEALRYLVSHGLRLVSRNFRCRVGEIDLIMLHGDCLTFVEVRFRKSTRFTAPSLTVDFRKQRKILRTAAMFLARQKHYARHTMRFDVVAISADSDNPVEWIQDAFRPADSTF